MPVTGLSTDRTEPCGQGRRALCGRAVVCLGVAAALLGGAVLLNLPRWRWLPTDDSAILELQLRHQVHHLPFLGAYSRFGWFHPGPMPRLLLWPVYWLSGQNGFAMTVGCTAVGLGIGWVALRPSGGRRGSTWTVSAAAAATFGGFIVSLVLSGRSVEFFAPWNPWMAATAFAGLMAALWRFDLRVPSHVAVWVVLGSLAIQNHVVSTMPVLAVTVVAVLGEARCGRRPGRGVLCGAAIAAAVMWFLPATEALIHRGGNARAIAASARHATEPRLGLGAAARVVGRWTALNSPFFGFREPTEHLTASVLPSHTGAVGPYAVVVMVAIAVIVGRRHRWATVGLGVLAVTAAAVVALAQGRGPVFSYTFAWFRPVVVTGVVVVGIAVVDTALRRGRVSTARFAPPLRGTVVGLGAAALVVAAVVAGQPNVQAQRQMRGVVAQLTTRKLPHRLAIASTMNGGAYGMELGLIAPLERAGHKVGADHTAAAQLGFDLPPAPESTVLEASDDCEVAPPGTLVAKYFPMPRSARERIARLTAEIRLATATGGPAAPNVVVANAGEIQRIRDRYPCLMVGAVYPQRR